MDVSESVYREIFLMMRYQLKNDQVFHNNLQLILTIIKNLVNDPTNRKYQRLRLSNDKIRKAIVECEQSQFVIELLGFQKARIEPEAAGVVQ